MGCLCVSTERIIKMKGHYVDEIEAHKLAGGHETFSGPKMTDSTKQIHFKSPIGTATTFRSFHYQTKDDGFPKYGQFFSKVPSDQTNQAMSNPETYCFRTSWRIQAPEQMAVPTRKRFNPSRLEPLVIVVSHFILLTCFSLNPAVLNI
jgi:hypothetical protein